VPSNQSLDPLEGGFVVFKSSPRRLLRRRAQVGMVSVLEARVLRASARNARLAFFLTLFAVGLLTATIIADRVHPILALFAGIAAGIVCGAAAWLLVRSWPILRLIWWWTPEILLSLTVVYGWTALATHTHSVVRFAILAVVVGVPAAIGPIRRRIIAWAWCLIVRHRLRVCFAEFIIANQSGTLPLILLARPTPVGERVWIYLRPGLSLSDLEARLDKIAVACHAISVIVERASQSTAAYLRVDIKRRDVLSADVGSPLVGLVDPDTPTIPRPVPDLPTALDLPDIDKAAVWGRPPRATGPSRTPPAPATSSPAATAVVTDVDDVTDWI